MHIDPERDDLHILSAEVGADAWAVANARAERLADEQRERSTLASAPRGTSPPSRAAFVDLRSLGRIGVRNQGRLDSVSFQPTQPNAPVGPQDVPFVSPVLRLDEMQQVTAAVGPHQASLYQTYDSVLWELLRVPHPPYGTRS